MADYLNLNKSYYDTYGYPAPNVESFIFRLYGRILKFDYGMDGSKHEKLLDFGCGAGSACRYFHDLGFDVYGVDISERDLQLARQRLPTIADHFVQVDPKPDPKALLAGGGFDVAISIQTLDFLSDTDFRAALQSIHNSMKPGAFIYASMTGSQCYYKKHSTPIGDGLHRVVLKTDRLDYDICLNFTDGEEHMKKKFDLFKCIYLDYYDSSFRNEGSEFRYTFFGQKE